MYRLRTKIRLKNKKFRPAMLSEQVKPFIDKYYELMIKRDSVGDEMRRKIRSCVTELAEVIDEEEAQVHSSSSNDSSGDSSPLSSASSGSRKSDLGFDELHLDEVPEDLRGPKKLEFLMIVKRDMLELLSSPLLKHATRRHFASSLCRESDIPESTYITWIVLSE